MLFCEDCGQCKYISNDDFIEIVSVSGTETRYIDCETGDVNDYGDSNVDSDGGDCDRECPHCSRGNIDYDWEGIEEEALSVRAAYEKEQEENREQRKKELYQVQTKESEWDLSHNM